MGLLRRLLVILPFLCLLAATSTSAQSFKCSSTTPCRSLVGYSSENASTLSDIQSLFGVKNLRSLLGANNLPLSTSRNFTIPAQQTVKVPIPCICYNNTGISNKVPIYTVKPDDGLFVIASYVFSGLLQYEQIVVVNKIANPNLIEVGEKLWIPLPCSCDQVNGEDVVHYAHVVAEGSTVEAIAAQFGSDTQTLLKLNGMNDSDQLIADVPFDVPLKACNSSIRSDSLDYPLLVANGSYAVTADNCVKCSCDSANNLTLQCEPSQLKPIKWRSCPLMQCEASGGLFIGNMTSSSSCNRSDCAYAGYNNQSIFTSLAVESTCPSPPSSSTPSNTGSKTGLNRNFIFFAFQVLLLSFYLS